MRINVKRLTYQLVVYVALFTGMIFLLMTDFSNQIMMELLPNTQMEMCAIAEDLRDGNITEPPQGYEISKESERIFVLSGWDGSWSKWSWSSNNYFALDSGYGWYHIMVTIVFPMLIPLLLSFVVVKVIPTDKFWNFMDRHF